MSSPSNKKGTLVASTTKPEEVFEDKVIWEQTVRTKNHLEHHHLIYGIGSKHLDVASNFLQNLLQEVSKRKT